MPLDYSKIITPEAVKHARASRLADSRRQIDSLHNARMTILKLTDQLEVQRQTTTPTKDPQ